MLGTGTVGVVTRWCMALLSVFIGIWGILPSFTGRFHAGCLTMVIVGGLGVAACIAFPKLSDFCMRTWENGVGRVILCSVAALAGALMILFVGISVCMITACAKRPQEDATLIVPGAALREDQPSRLLRGRLEAAYAYLVKHPNAVCIVSGGQGEDEICTEASVMQTYLINKGIDPARIYTEDRSTSTFENIRYSREVIETYGLNPNVAIVTQEFHQFRTQQFVKQAGLTVSGAVTAHTPWHLLASYWIRDFAGVCHMALLGT